MMEDPALSADPEAIEVNYRLSDFNAVMFQRWRHYVAVSALIVGLICGVPLIFDILDGVGLAAALEQVGWVLPSILIMFFATLIFASNALGFLWGKRKSRIVSTRFLLTDEGVRMENNQGSSFLFWPTLRRVSSSANRLFLFITPHVAFVLPRRSFKDMSQFDRWVELAKLRFDESKSRK